MFEVIFYKTKTGHEPAKEFISDVRSKKGKDAEVNIEKIDFYIQLVSIFGLKAGLPYVHLGTKTVKESNYLRSLAQWNNCSFTWIQKENPQNTKI